MWIKESEIYNSFRYNKQVYNIFLIVVKRYIDITVRFVKGLVNAMFHKKYDIEVKFKGTR